MDGGRPGWRWGGEGEGSGFSLSLWEFLRTVIKEVSVGLM